MKNAFDKATQILLPVLSISTFALTSIKRPDLGLIASLSAQIFWMYSGYQAWKKANQYGIIITTIAITLIDIYGIINYFFIK